ncbi:MAG: c-type cytochrome [Hyphomonas sp.]
MDKPSDGSEPDAAPGNHCVYCRKAPDFPLLATWNPKLMPPPLRPLLASLALIAACDSPSDPPPRQPPPAEASPALAAPVRAAPVEPNLEFASLPAPYNTASYSAGNRTWKLCQSCHMTAEGAGNLVGPNLYGLFARQVASAEGFDYSPALKAETFTWTPERLDEWLANPRGFLPGNRMSFAGVRKPEDRLALIAYLMVETGYVSPAEEAAAPE